MKIHNIPFPFHPLFHKQHSNINFINSSKNSPLSLTDPLMFMDSQTQPRYSHNGKVMLCSAILLFIIVLTIIFLHTYRHSCFGRRRHHHRRIPPNSATAFKKGLPPSLINFLPAFTFSAATHRPLHDCAVCLSDFSDGDQVRTLPNCNHAFHSHCIDAWFRSHSNCPLCRTPVHPPVQPALTNSEPGSVGCSCSAFPAPVGCPKKPLELVGIIVELENERLRGWETGSGTRISRLEKGG